MAIPAHLRDLPEDDPRRLFHLAMEVCEWHGYPVSDPDYGSAVNAGVLAAMNARPNPDHPKTHLAVFYSLRECGKMRSYLSAWRRRQCLRPTSESVRTKVVISPAALDVADDALLTFVAAMGKTKAARMLRLHPYKVDELLDEAVLRLKNRGELQDEVEL